MTKPRKPRKPSKDSVKAALARAEATSKGEPIPETKVAITPEIIPAKEIKAKAKAAKKRHGRPTKYTPAIGKAICKMMAMGMSVRKIGRRPLMPSAPTIIGWSIDPEHPFSEQFARASAVKFTLMAEDLIDIADDGSNDWMEREAKDGSIAIVLNREALERSRLRLDTRWKILAQALPKFVDRIRVEHTGAEGGPIETRELPKPIPGDHLSDITRRFASRVPADTLASGPAKTAEKPAKGAGLH